MVTKFKMIKFSLQTTIRKNPLLAHLDLLQSLIIFQNFQTLKCQNRRITHKAGEKGPGLFFYRLIGDCPQFLNVGCRDATPLFLL